MQSTYLYKRRVDVIRVGIVIYHFQLYSWEIIWKYESRYIIIVKTASVRVYCKINSLQGKMSE